LRLARKAGRSYVVAGDEPPRERSVTLAKVAEH
jgi:hypothetical protein